MEKVLNGKNLFDLQGKIVLITGSGTGLGEGYAHIFTEVGATVICADINTDAAGKVVKDIVAQGGKAEAVKVDVTSQQSIDAMVAEVVKKHGRIDVLLNNAGVEDIAAFQDVTPAQYDKIHAVNLRGTFFVAQAVAKEMKKSGGGKIINIGSLGSYIGLARSSVYCSTKGGVVQLSKTMALELAADNIQVNCIAPGYYITPMTMPFFNNPERRAWIEERIPLGRWGTVADLAGPILFLASAASNYITGVTINVDGGWLAG
jgi:Dehydrogenases with different specificities (related to short-chain alcohol dehydrogenases)